MPRNRLGARGRPLPASRGRRYAVSLKSAGARREASPGATSRRTEVAISTVYRKSAKGQAEIETRAHRLPPRLRGALILVDGKRGDDELLRMIPGDAADTLQQLATNGFIEVLGQRHDPLPPSASAAERAAPAAEPRREASFESLRRDAVRMLNEQLGPAAESVAMKIERAKTMPELRPLLATAATTLRNFRGAAVADAFVARFLAEEAAA